MDIERPPENVRWILRSIHSIRLIFFDLSFIQINLYTIHMASICLSNQRLMMARRVSISYSK